MNKLDVIPSINGDYVPLEGVFMLPPRFAINSEYPEADRIFAGRIRRLGDYLVTVDSPAVIFSVNIGKLDHEAYRILVEQGRVTIYSNGERGYFYGLTTLFQMLVMGKGALNSCALDDSPRFEKRSLMLDVCRHMFSIEEIKRILDQMSLLKMNQFHWHLSDDQGFRIESERFPELNTISAYRKLSPQDPVVARGLDMAGAVYGGYYLKSEIREVIDYAKARQIEVVPELELPGHSSAILAAFPQYTCTGEPLKVKGTFGVHERIFCAGNEAVYPFIFELLDELCELFPSKYIHLGGDEAPKKSWKSCPVCQSFMKDNGISSYEGLQTLFTNRLIAHVRKKGKIPVVWNESAISGDLDEDAVLQYWMEMAPGPSYVVPELAKGRRLILSCSDQFYCTPSYADLPLRATLMFEPEIKGVKVPDLNVLGIETAVWTEWSPENIDIEQTLYPRLLAVAECGWTKERDYSSFAKRAEAYLKYPALNILQPTPWSEATIHGEQALRTIAVNMVDMGRRYKCMTEGDADEEGGKAEAVLPENTQNIDKAVMTRIFIENKMKAAYTPEEIERVIGMVMNLMNEEDE